MLEENTSSRLLIPTGLEFRVTDAVKERQVWFQTQNRERSERPVSVSASVGAPQQIKPDR